MCTAFEVIIKAEKINEEKERIIEKIFKDKEFTPEVTTVRKLEIQKQKEIEKRKQWEENNPEEYRMFKLAYEEMEAEELRLEYNQTHQNMIIISCNTAAGRCLCDIEAEQVHRLLKELLEEADELYYDPSSDMYYHPESIFWTTDKEISITDEHFDWKPSMSFRERVKITKY